MAETAKWWETLPPDVQALLNLTQVFVSARDRLDETREIDFVRLRRLNRLDVNAIVDQFIKAESDLTEAVRVYKKAGGNFREAARD